MSGKPNKYVKDVYELILAAEHQGISSTDIAKTLGLKTYNIKVPLINLKRKKTIYSNTTLALNKNGNPDGRSVLYYASVYKKGMPMNAEQLATVNKIRIGKKISEVGK